MITSDQPYVEEKHTEEQHTEHQEETRRLTFHSLFTVL